MKLCGQCLLGLYRICTQWHVQPQPGTYRTRHGVPNCTRGPENANMHIDPLTLSDWDEIR